MKEAWEKMPGYAKFITIGLMATAFVAIGKVMPDINFYFQAKKFHEADAANLVEAKKVIEKKADVDQLVMTQNQLDELQSWARTNQKLIEAEKEWQAEQRQLPQYSNPYNFNPGITVPTPEIPLPSPRKPPVTEPPPEPYCEWEDGIEWCWDEYDRKWWRRT